MDGLWQVLKSWLCRGLVGELIFYVISSVHNALWNDFGNLIEEFWENGVTQDFVSNCLSWLTSVAQVAGISLIFLSFPVVTTLIIIVAVVILLMILLIYM